MLLLLAGCLFSCKHSKYNREAIELNDSAVAIQMKQGLSYEKQSLNDAIALYDKAITIDSTYFLAYFNKFLLQTQIQHYNEAIETGKKAIKMRPNDGTLKMLLGETYERMGDTITSKKLYNNALLDFDDELKKDSVDSKLYKNAQYNKACDLIILHEKEKADGILKELIDKENSLSGNKWMYLEAIGKSREEIIYGATSMSEIKDGVRITTKTINSKSTITREKL